MRAADEGRAAPAGGGGAATPAELLDLLLTEAVGRGAAGVEALYRYASDKMRGKVGSIEVFHRAFGNDLYAPLLSHADMRAAEPTIIDDSARVELRVTAGAGEEVVYQLGFVRGRHGTRAGLWTLSGVVREGVDL